MHDSNPTTTPQRFLVDGAPAPVGPFSHASAHAGLLYISGQVGFRPGTSELVGDDFASQCVQTFDNLRHIADQCGASLAAAVKLNVFLKTMDDFTTFNAIYPRYFDQPYPARTTIPAGDLTVLIEVDAVIALDA